MRRNALSILLSKTILLSAALWLTACGGGTSSDVTGNGPNQEASGNDASTANTGGGSGIDFGQTGGEGSGLCDGGVCLEVDAGPYCGNGIIDGELQETCDDGNALGGDGCSGTCKFIEPNFTCPTAGQPCVNSVVCGNSVKDIGEGCDDGNTVADDGCNARCAIERGWVCATPGAPCTRLVNCGDGRISAGELCDDHNTTAGDGCDADCRVEPGYRCQFIAGASDCRVVSICGDGAVDADEQCDDGNTLDGDCCSSLCRREGAYCSCPPTGGACTDTSACGNGVLEKVELCDDNNLDAGDGCDPACNLEAGWQCRMAGMPCVPLCGDGVLTGGEECDDANRASGDGCTGTCMIEPGFSCTGLPSVCAASVCGNGMVEAGETCDAADANGLFYGDGSGCSKTCTQEPICRDAAGATMRCTPVCGDANREADFEDCDDGNLVDGDGCSATCMKEDGFTCTEQEKSDTETCEGTAAQCLTLPITFRDFDGANVASTGHPDFFFMGPTKLCVPNASGAGVDTVNNTSGGACWTSDATELCSGLVAPALGPGGKPVVNPGSDLTCPCRFTDWDETGLLATAAGTTTCTDAGSGLTHTRIDTVAQAITSAASFTQWYTDSTSSTKVVSTIQLAQLAGTNLFQFSSSNGLTVYDDLHDIFVTGSGTLDSGFFPLDTQTGVGSTKVCNLWPYWVVPATATCATGTASGVSQQWDPRGSFDINTPDGDGGSIPGSGTDATGVTGMKRNFYFTSEVRYLFRYAGGEELSFFGDDDVWVFINGVLVLDLGAPHERLQGTVELTATGASYTIEGLNVATNRPIAVANGTGDVGGLGLVEGGTYEIAVFHADRHPRESNYQLTLSGFSTISSVCAPFCGDSVVTGAEECDLGDANADGVYGGCGTDCRFGPFCGDAEVNGDEQCDDGRNTTVAASVGGCAPGCVFPPTCGDGNIDPGEQCDDGAAANIDGTYSIGVPTCSSTCQLNPYCGDGVVDAAQNEECDDGLNIGGYGFCGASCLLGPRCGDSIVQNTPEIDGSAEQCDDGNTDDLDGCTNDCGVPGYCGDSIVQEALGELCDLGAANTGEYGGCNPDCSPAPYCGDGVTQTGAGDPPEQCDYGSKNESPANASYGGCLQNCQLGPHCGDGISQASEQCDDGNTSEGDNCTNACIARIF